MNNKLTVADVLPFPAWIIWGQRRGALVPQPAGTGAAGRKLCRWCGTEVPKGSRAWCSMRCHSRYMRVWPWDSLVKFIIERDQRCRRCRCDHPGWNQSRYTERHATVAGVYDWTQYEPTGGVKCLKPAYKFTYCQLVPWWEVDHILPVKDGGTDDPANLRLLCHACHLAVGYEQRAARLALVQPVLL